VHADLRPGNYVSLTVTDTGTGMAPEVKARIFEPFFTTKGVGKGTGLGLAVVHGIIQQSGGHIQVTSEPDIGTSFRIVLPAVTEKLLAPKCEMDAEVHGTQAVLLVEDEDAVRSLALFGLQSYGYKILAARNGKEALHLIATYHGDFDLLVTDVVMPDIDGPRLADALRSRLTATASARQSASAKCPSRTLITLPAWWIP
jgi:hypothetical protein